MIYGAHVINYHPGIGYALLQPGTAIARSLYLVLPGHVAQTISFYCRMQVIICERNRIKSLYNKA